MEEQQRLAKIHANQELERHEAMTKYGRCTDPIVEVRTSGFASKRKVADDDMPPLEDIPIEEGLADLLQEKYSEVERLRKHRKLDQQRIKEKDDIIASCKRSMSTLTGMVTSRDDEIIKQRGTIEDKTNTILRLLKETDEQHTLLQSSKNSISHLVEMVRDRDREIEEQKKEIRQLRELLEVARGLQKNAKRLR